MNPDQTITLNQNAAACIQSTSKFGETIYTNICNGSVHSVAWGGVDWASAIFLMALGAAIIVFLIGFGLAMASDL